MNKEGSFKPVAIALIASMIIAFFWDQLEFLKKAVGAILNPTAGALMSWNLDWGMTIIVLVLAVATTLIQKYTTDQETLRDLKRQQKELNERMKQHRNDPSKMMEMQKEIWPISTRMMKLSMRAIAYTAIPLILFFRWFSDYFSAIENPSIFGFFSWFVFYLVLTLIASSILRKVFKVV